ncbi:hypothetical protein LZZ85_21415 [Terrimonas sp. NA20]|uniref:Peptidase M14 n=1 Tax=Terrimonas ginsenosidimutans TaxID=2908004 RepID=A0ABS9KX31_9BACT|nr:hypothetical protein [Terrimonas ginsenosidimutans]MCG2616870.1 hypothetical protein [Terrimonas ginsenosidimutans]
MKIQLHITYLLTSVLFLSFADRNSSGSRNVSADTTGKGRPAINASFASAEHKLTERFYTTADLDELLQRNQPAGIQLGTTRQGRSLNAWYFPGTSDKRALVIGGVHGSELSSIEVAQALVERLMSADEQPYYSVIVIPALFPDNAATAMRMPEQTGSVLNIGRYTHEQAVDPNRQMPSPGANINDDELTDHLSRRIEKENQLLLQLIRDFKPDRIASVHAIRNINYGGIYADPRTDANGIALGYASDSSLAVDMSILVDQQQGNVDGNHLKTRPTALYYKDPTPVAAGLPQKRNTVGAALKANRGSGISMGTWGTTAIEKEKNNDLNRDAMRVITIEVPGARRSFDYKTDQQKAFFRNQMLAFVNAIHHIFLGNHHVED